MESLRRGGLCGCLTFAVLVWGTRCAERAANSVEQVRAGEEQAWQERKKSLQVFAEDLKERERRERRAAKIERLENQPPPVADKPPFPRAQIDANPVDLGTIPVGQPGSHKFKIKNAGQAPLVIFRPDYGCHRAVPLRRQIAPGDSTEIEVAFTLREAAPYFAETVTLWSNDPAHRELVLEIHGTPLASKGAQ